MLTLSELPIDNDNFPEHGGFLTLLENWYNKDPDTDIIDKLNVPFRLSGGMSLQLNTVLENVIVTDSYVQGIMATYLDKDIAWCQSELPSLFYYTFRFVDACRRLSNIADLTRVDLDIDQIHATAKRLLLGQKVLSPTSIRASVIYLMLCYIRYKLPVNKLCRLCEHLTIHGFTILLNQINTGDYCGTTPN